MEYLNPDNIKSSKKAAKMARKLARKQANTDARAAVADFQEQLNKKLTIFNKALKQRPKYVPQKVWNWLASFFIDVDSIEQHLTFK